MNASVKERQAWIDLCKQSLAHFKVPKHIKMVNDFPMTVTGKMQKFVMRDAFADELGLS